MLSYSVANSMIEIAAVIAYEGLRYSTNWYHTVGATSRINKAKKRESLKLAGCCGNREIGKIRTDQIFYLFSQLSCLCLHPQHVDSATKLSTRPIEGHHRPAMPTTAYALAQDCEFLFTW